MTPPEFHRTTFLGNLFGQASLFTLESFCQRMGMGLKAGVDVLKMLDSEAKVGSERHKQVALAMKNQIRGGETLVGAMKHSGDYFPPMLLQMVSAGEISGGLDRLFAYMAAYYRDLRGSRADFFRQLVKPMLQLVLALAVVSGIIFLQGFLASPQVSQEEKFDPLGFGLSGTRGLAIFWFFMGGFLVVLGVVAVGIWKNAMNCHRWLIPLILPVPVLGSVFANTALARMSMTLSMLLNAGADAVLCVRQAFLSTGNEYYIQGEPKATECVQQGMSLAESFQASGVVPNEFVEGVSIGELSGSETESLERLATEYDRRAKVAMGQLCIAASTAIAVATSLLIIFLIIRMAMQYVAMLQSFM